MRNLVFALCFVCSSALAQPIQQPDPATMQKAIAIIQAQRNQALDAQAGAETRAAMLADENAKLKAQIEELQKKSAAPAESQTPSQPPARK